MARWRNALAGHQSPGGDAGRRARELLDTDPELRVAVVAGLEKHQLPVLSGARPSRTPTGSGCPRRKSATASRLPPARCN